MTRWLVLRNVRQHLHKKVVSLAMLSVTGTRLAISERSRVSKGQFQLGGPPKPLSTKKSAKRPTA